MAHGSSTGHAVPSSNYTNLAWSITLAAAYAHTPPSPLFSMFGLFGLGAFIMRGAGCTINDLWDKDLDNKVARTKTQPLAAKD